MNLRSTKVKANSWLTTAAEEIRRIQTRWRVPSRKQFSKLLGINERSLAKLYKVPVDDTLQYGTVQQMFSNLMTSVQFEFNTPEDVNIEMQLLAQALTNVVRAAFPPKQELVNKAIHEMDMINSYSKIEARPKLKLMSKEEAESKFGKIY